MRLPVMIGTDVARRAFASLAAAALLCSEPLSQPALAKTDSKAIAQCLITKAPGALARCVADPTCAANLVCINTCTNKPDESECQIKCGDEFSNDVVAGFTKSVVSDNKCVPQRQDDGAYPVPKDEVLVQKFNTEEFVGDWYISAGLNKAFDTFDCQLHKFEAPTPRKLVGNLQWRIKDPIAGTQFVTRYTVQTFDMDATRPGILYNHDNEFLHYEDDWYIIAQREGEYVAVYYRGNNDAWDGYGGAVVYSKNPVLDKKWFPELDAAFQKVGHSWSEFTLTDNTCKPRETKLKEFEEDFVFVETRVAGSITSNPIIQEIERELIAVEKEIEKDIIAVEKEVVKDVVAVEKEIVKDATALEQEVEKDVKGLFSNFGRK